MENRLEYDLSYLPNKKSRRFRYEMKLINNKSNLIIHARKSKKGGETIGKLFDDAMFLFINGAWDIESWIKNGDFDKILSIQQKNYDESTKLFGVPLIGWSPDVIKKIKESAKKEGLI